MSKFTDKLDSAKLNLPIFMPQKPEKPKLITWEEWRKNFCREQIREPVPDSHECEDKDWCDCECGNLPAPLTIKDFQDVADKHGVPVELVVLHNHIGSNEVDFYFEIYKPYDEKLMAKEKKRWQEYADEEFPKEMKEYEEEYAFYEKEMEEYKVKVKERQLKKAEALLKEAEEIKKEFGN